jgi:hypothetical protein
MSTVSQFITQKSKIATYNSGNCNDPSITSTVPCSPNDWNYSTFRCGNGFGSQQYYCSKIDPTICPMIGRYPVSQTFDPAPTVRCTYDMRSFQNENDLDIWISRWGKDSTYNLRIMPNFCSIPSTNCPINPQTGMRMTTCSRLVSNDSEGRQCQDWALENPQLASSTESEICGSGSVSQPDCLCVNRRYDALYNDIKPYVPSYIPDVCWWKPCTNSSAYIVPPSDNIQSTTCPSNTCEIINGIINSRGLQNKYSAEELSVKIVCPITPVSSGLWIWLIILFIVIIIFIGIIVYIYYNNDDNNTVIY